MKTILKFSILQALCLAFSFSVKADATEDLFSSIYKGNLNGVQKAISDGADVNAIHANGLTPLLLSMWYPELTGELIKAKADVNKPVKDNTFTPLIYACLFGSFETITQLVDAGANINAATSYGATAYLAAVPLYRLDVLKYLEGKGAHTKALNGFNQDALMLLAAAPKSPSSLSAFYKSLEDAVIKAGNPVPPMIKKLQNETLYNSADEMMEHLLSLGFDLDKTTDVKIPDNMPDAAKTNKANKKIGAHQSAISIAAKTGNTAFIKTYFAKGGNTGALNEKFPSGYEIKRFSNIFTPAMLTDVDALFQAVKSGDMELVKLLLDHKAGSADDEYKGTVSPCNVLFKIEGFTLLMLAANEGNLEMCRLLVERGAKGMDKCTLSIVGSKKGNEIACGEYLVQKALSYPENFATKEDVKNYLKGLKK